jgi:hypothetical protein
MEVEPVDLEWEEKRRVLAVILVLLVVAGLGGVATVAIAGSLTKRQLAARIRDRSLIRRCVDGRGRSLVRKAVFRELANARMLTEEGLEVVDFSKQYRVNVPTFEALLLVGIHCPRRCSLSNFFLSNQELQSTPVIQKAHYAVRAGRQSYPLVFQLAVALHRFGTGYGVRGIAHSYGISESAVWQACEMVANALLCLETKYIRWPTAAERKELCAAAGKNVNNKDMAFAGVVGMIDGSYIRNMPTVSKEQIAFFRCRKGFVATLLQGVVDHTGKFISYTCGVPSNANDKGLLADSPLGKMLLARPDKLLSDGEYLLGDSGYTLSLHVLTPYPDYQTKKESAEAIYNYAHASLRNPVERAYGVLKGRWACMQELPIHHDRASLYVRGSFLPLVVSHFLSPCVCAALFLPLTKAQRA